MTERSTASPAFGPNAWLVDDMYEQYLADPSSVSESWQEFFADYRGQGGDGSPRQASTVRAEPEVEEAEATPVKAATEPAPETSAVPKETQTEKLRGAAARVVY